MSDSMVDKSVLPSAAMIEVLVDGARYGDMEDVQSALRHSVDVNSADAMGRTGKPGCAFSVELHSVTSIPNAALHMAAANGHTDVAAALIEAGAVSLSSLPRSIVRSATSTSIVQVLCC